MEISKYLKPLILSALFLATTSASAQAQDVGFGHAGTMTFQGDISFNASGGLRFSDYDFDPFLEDVTKFNAGIGFGVFVIDGLMLSARLDLATWSASDPLDDTDDSYTGFVILFQPAYYYPLDVAKRFQLMGYAEIGYGAGGVVSKNDVINEVNESRVQYAGGIGLATIIGGESGLFVQLSLGYEAAEISVDFGDGTEVYSESKSGLQSKVSLGGYF